MLVRFEGENSGSFVMFGDVAEQLLRMMGMSGKPEGALRKQDVAAALASLEAAIEPHKAQQSEQDADADDNDDGDATVGLATRAAPLLDLLRQVKNSGGYVMWRPEG